MDDIEPLASATWFSALKKLSNRIRPDAGADVECLLRHGYHLVQLAPRALRPTIRSDLNEARFEQLLEAEAFDCAALGLVGRPLSYAVSRLGEDLFEARVHGPERSEPVEARSSAFGLALLGAWSGYLIAMEGRAIPLQSGIAIAARGKTRPGRVRRPSAAAALRLDAG